MLPDGEESIAKPKPIKRPAKQQHQRRASDEGTLEAEIREFDPEILGGITADNLKSFVKISRGVLTPGVHLMLTPRENEITITTRLARRSPTPRIRCRYSVFTIRNL